MTDTTRIVDRYEPLLGTVVEITVELSGTARDDIDQVSESIAGEMLRLQSILSSVDPASEFSRWTRGQVDRPSEELSTVLVLASHWHSRSGGRFNPAAGVLTQRWTRAAAENATVDDAELERLAAAIAAPRWEVVGGEIRLLRDASDCTLNALAKGWIADRAAELATTVEGLVLVAVNAGGDIARRGTAPLLVGIEDPFTPFDTSPPMTVVELRAGGLATSGSARKWFDVAGTRQSHVLDPRTGRPVDGCASISVVAATAAEADVVATMLGVQPADAAVREAESLGFACLAVDGDGAVHATDAWRAIERSVS